MSVPEFRRRGFLLPEEITGHPVKSVCIDIPDVAEYRQAFWGHMWELGNWHVWQKLDNADDRDQQAAAYWREILSTNYTRWLEDEGCAPSTCREYPPSAGFIEWFPNNPYLSPDFVGEGYNNPAWYLATTASNIAYGSSFGDAITSLDRFPPGSLPSVIPASGLPRFRINVSGAGTVKAQLVNLFGGSLIQTTTDDDILTIKFTDVSRDTVSVPPETQDELILEFEFTTPGHHHIDFIVISWVNSSIPFLHHGGGLRKVELCGFETMPVVTPPFRMTEECGLEYYNGEEWITVDGWGEFAEDCFAAPPVHLRENLATGLEVDEDPLFGTPTLIHAYYRADALRAAVRFYARDNAAELILKNAADTTKLRLGIVGSINEFDTRESELLIRFGAGAINTRRLYFNTNGTVQLINSVIAATAKFEVFNDVSSLSTVKFEGRTGQATGTAVLNLGVVNQESAGTDAYAILARGLNSVTATRAPGIFVVDKHGRVLHSDYDQTQVLTSGTTPQTYKLGQKRTVTLLDISGANYRSHIALAAYKDSVEASPAIRYSVTDDDEPAVAFNNQPPIPKQDISGTAEGNQLLFDIVAALATVGLINIESVTLGENCCEGAEACVIYDFTLEPYNSDWNVVSGNWVDEFGWSPAFATGSIILNMLFSPDIEITYLRVAGTNASNFDDVFTTATLDSEELISLTSGAMVTNWSASNTFTAPDGVGTLLEIEVACDTDNPASLTTVEIHYVSGGGVPSGGVECDP